MSWTEENKLHFGTLISLNGKYLSLWPEKGGRDGPSCSFTPLSVKEASQPSVLVLADAIQAAIDELDLLGAVTQKEGQLVLTPLGKKMAAFPLDPKFSKVKTAEKLTFFRSHVLISVLLMFLFQTP